MLIFNEHGLLTPAEGISTTIDDLYYVFVRPFDTSETRERLFQDWQKYNWMLRQEIGVNYIQWIDAGRPLPKLCNAKIKPERH